MLLDTCAAIWLAEHAEISKPAQEALAEAAADGASLYISPITAWEIGLLVSKNRLKLSTPPLEWFERVTANPRIRVVDLSPRILVASSLLPDAPPSDPADRIIAATARENALCVLTRDRHLLRYANKGHILALAC